MVERHYAISIDDLLLPDNFFFFFFFLRYACSYHTIIMLFLLVDLTFILINFNTSQHLFHMVDIYQAFYFL